MVDHKKLLFMHSDACITPWQLVILTSRNREAVPLLPPVVAANDEPSAVRGCNPLSPMATSCREAAIQSTLGLLGDPGRNEKGAA